MAASVLACSGPSSQTTGTTATKQPKKGGILRHPAYLDLSGQGFDPHVVSAPNAEPFSLFYQSLIGFETFNFEIMPELAQKWEQPSPTQVVFTLQPGVKWHNKAPANGRDMTAQDVVFSLERVRTEDPRYQHRGLLDTIDKIEAVDASSVRFTMKEPDASVLAKLSSPGIFILNREVVEKAAGKFASADVVVGTGPFIMTDYEEGTRANYVRNPNYWKPGLPYLDGISEAYFADPNTQWAAFVAGELDATAVPGSEVKRYIERQGPGYKPFYYGNFSYLLAQANLKREPMNDARIPKALRLLINQEEHIKTVAEVYNGQGRHGFIFPPSTSSWDLTHEEYAAMLQWKQPKTDAIREAVSLLSAAGYTRERPLEFEITGGGQGFAPNVRPSSELLHAQFNQNSQGSVRATIQLHDLPTQNRLRSQGAFTYLIGGTTGWSDPDITLTIQINTGGSRNYIGFSDARTDALIKRQRGIFNAQERKGVIKEIVTHLNDVYPASATAIYSNVSGAQPTVQNYAPEAGFNGRTYEQVWLDT
jgi:ABC-type transport system substrate-binding protein